MQFKTQKPTVAEINMTPMIDIVFQLIAFFMLISNFEQTQADERVKLPKDQLAKPPEVKPLDELVLNVGYQRDSSGEDQGPVVFYGGEFYRVAGFGPETIIVRHNQTQQQVPVRDFAPVLKRERQLYKDLGKQPKEVTIVIRADALVPTGLVQELIKLAQEAGFETFKLKAAQATTGT